MQICHPGRCFEVGQVAMLLLPPLSLLSKIKSAVFSSGERLFYSNVNSTMHLVCIGYLCCPQNRNFPKILVSGGEEEESDGDFPILAVVYTGVSKRQII